MDNKIDFIGLIYDAYINEPVYHGAELDRVIELEDYFKGILSAKDYEFFKEFDENLMELRILSERRLIKFVLRLFNVAID